MLHIQRMPDHNEYVIHINDDLALWYLANETENPLVIWDGQDPEGGPSFNCDDALKLIQALAMMIELHRKQSA